MIEADRESQSLGSNSHPSAKTPTQFPAPHSPIDAAVGDALGSWRLVDAPEGTQQQQSLLCGEAPFLFSFRSSDGEHVDTAMAVRISFKNDRPPNVYERDIPKDHIGSFLITAFHDRYILVENQEKCTGIHVVDPFSSSWAPLASFPSRNPSSPDLGIIWKVVTRGHSTAPGSIAVAIAGPAYFLAFTNLGLHHRWIVQDEMKQLGEFADLIWSNGDGLFHALTSCHTKVLSLQFDEAAGSSQYTATSSSLEPKYEPTLENYHLCTCFENARLIDSPSGLFLVRWRLLLNKNGMKEKKKREIDVYRMSVDGAERKWQPVKSLGGYSFFLGNRQCLVLSSEDFPGLRSNLIYLPSDGSFYMGGAYIEDYEDELEYYLIYNLAEDEWDQCYGMEDETADDMQWPAVWIMPRLREHVWKRKREEQLETETTATSGEMECE